MLLVGRVCLGGPLAPTAAAAEVEPWEAMDYGPFLTASIEAPEPAGNLAYKGLAIRLAGAFGGQAGEAVLFDTDLLRYAAGWNGNYVALKGVVFDGEHWAYPKTDGPQVFGNPPVPGWAHNGSFADPRPQPYGPLPRSHARWRGLYLHGPQVILSYTVGDMTVLERPGLARGAGLTAFERTLNLGPTTQTQAVQVAFSARRPTGRDRCARRRAGHGVVDTATCPTRHRERP